MARIIELDIETAPNIGYVYRMFKENLRPSQIKEYGCVLSFCAKDLQSGIITYQDQQSAGGEETMIRHAIDILNDADIVIAHNAQFDVGTLFARAVKYGIPPPSPFQTICTLQAARKHFRFPHNSLEGLANYLGLERRKEKHAKFPEMELWIQCLAGNPEAWDELRDYNISDVLLLEEVYIALRPWIKGHPNIGIFEEQDVPVCGKCGSKHLHRRGYYRTNVGKYARFQCQDCGGWSSSRFTELEPELRKALIKPV